MAMEQVPIRAEHACHRTSFFARALPARDPADPGGASGKALHFLYLILARMLARVDPIKDFPVSYRPLITPAGHELLFEGLVKLNGNPYLGLPIIISGGIEKEGQS